MRRLLLTAFLLALFCSEAGAAEPGSRYFHHGNGRLKLATNKGSARFDGTFRNPDGTYDEAALAQINKVFSARYGNPISEISPRLIEFIDFLQDRFDAGALVTITSGYRSPTYNTGLRNRGKLAAKASLHQYGMAADLHIKGVRSDSIWNFIKGLGFGGAGYYHGKNIHIDVGPARFWDETTSGVGTGISDDNKLIAIVTDRDVYLPGEEMKLRFIRMTSFPIGVSPTFVLERMGRKGKWRSEDFIPTLPGGAKGGCPKFSDIGQMMGIAWTVPADAKPGHYRVRAKFCNKEYEEMPNEVVTPEFEVAAL